MQSAFGVDHGMVAKSLKPQHLAALKRVAERHPSLDEGFRAFTRHLYAHDRVNLHGLSEHGELARHMTISRGMYKPKPRYTRTKRADRDKNRKPIFGAPDKQRVPKPRTGD